MGTAKESPYDLFPSFPQKPEAMKINYRDSPIMSGNEKKMNNERFPYANQYKMHIPRSHRGITRT